MLDSLTQYNMVSNYWSEWGMVQTLAHTPGREGGGTHISVQQIMGQSVTISLQKERVLGARSQKINDLA